MSRLISEITDGLVYVEFASTGGVTITHGLTGKPMEQTPDGIPIAGVTFKDEAAAQKFIAQHWPAPVITKDVRVK